MSVIHQASLGSQTQTRLLENKLHLAEQQLADLQKETDFERREFQQEITKLLQESKAADVQKDGKLEQARSELLEVERRLARKDAELEIVSRK